MKTIVLQKKSGSTSISGSGVSWLTFYCSRGRLGFIVLALGGLMVTVLLASAVGAVVVPIGDIVGILLRPLPFLGITPDWSASHEAIILQIRLPRVILAGLVGASLAAAGATYQGLFRNPLADPYLIGVASGAGLGAVIGFLLPFSATLFGLGLVQLMAFAGALSTITVVYSLARVSRTTPVTTLILAGVAVGALASAATTLLLLAAGDKLRPIYSWLLGGFALSYWLEVLAVLPYIVPSLLTLLLYSRPLNVMQLDEEQAQQLGINTERLKLVLVSAASLATAAAVSVSGLIGFAGLIVPHIIRLIWGPDYRFLLPMSMILGSIFLILADLVARTVLAPGEVPVGIITAFCGAPFFLYLLRQKKRAVF